jgi:hypothetical protein
MENYDVHGNEHLHHKERAVETVNVDVNGKEEHLHCNEDVPCDKYFETRMKGNVDGEDNVNDDDDKLVEEEHFDSCGQLKCYLQYFMNSCHGRQCCSSCR